MELPDKLIIDGKEYKDDLSLKSFQKKERKAKAIILKIEKKQNDDLFSSVPTPYLYCCNFGAGSGINQEKVIQFFKKFDGFLRIESEKSKPWVTLVFDSSENASKVMFYHGKYSVEEFDRYFILFYSKSLPVSQTEIIPNGLVFIPNFVTEEEEKSLMNDILNSEGEWEVLQLRTVKHWGYKYDYKTKLISPNSVPPIPQFFQKMIDRIVDEKILPFAPDQITVNMYQPGDGIPSHIETHSVFDDGVVSLSLESQIILEMKHPDSTLANIVLTPRSLLILKGESRYLWTHGISSRKTDLVNGVLVERGHRISITFRKVKIGIPCNCPYYAQCDSMLFDFAERSEKRENSRIEENYVKDVYDSIATHFSDTRHTAWPNIQKFLNDLPNDSLVCDVGCGNGKYFNSNPNITLIGNDQSIPLLEIAKTKGRDVFACNILTLPIKDNTFDCVISIAVIHHLSTEKHRLRALQEIVRILKPGGKMLIYVWAMEQEKRKFGQQDVMVPWNMDEKRIDKLIEEKGDSESGIKIKSLVDQAPKKENYVIFQRYYHVFRQGELTYLLKQIPGLEVFPEVYDQDNWTAVAIVHKK